MVTKKSIHFIAISFTLCYTWHVVPDYCKREYAGQFETFLTYLLMQRKNKTKGDTI